MYTGIRIPVSRHTACLVTAWPTMSNINFILCAHTHTHAHTHTRHVPMKCTSQCHMHNAIMLPSLPPAKGTILLTVQTLFRTVHKFQTHSVHIKYYTYNSQVIVCVHVQYLTSDFNTQSQHLYPIIPHLHMQRMHTTSAYTFGITKI